MSVWPRVRRSDMALDERSQLEIDTQCHCDRFYHRHADATVKMFRAPVKSQMIPGCWAATVIFVGLLILYPGSRTPCLEVFGTVWGVDPSLAKWNAPVFVLTVETPLRAPVPGWCDFRGYSGRNRTSPSQAGAAPHDGSRHARGIMRVAHAVIRVCGEDGGSEFIRAELLPNRCDQARTVLMGLRDAASGTAAPSNPINPTGPTPVPRR
jgi:hypothetical protein